MASRSTIARLLSFPEAFMRRNIRYLAATVVILFCASGGVAWWAMEAVRNVRPFYREAMSVDSSILREAGKEFSSRASALVNDAQSGMPWQAVFTEDQVNGWLAFDLPEKHADLLPREFADPRVAFAGEQLSIGVRYRGARFETVFSVDVVPYLAEPNVLGLRILGAKAGTLPIPLNEVTERLTQAADQLRIPLAWIQESEMPTALLGLQLTSPGDGRRLRLDTLRLAGSALQVGGVAARESPSDVRASDENSEPRRRKCGRGQKPRDARSITPRHRVPNN
jgi:hypothetical protein